MISGPEDTPYSNGLFLFDAFFPETYPTTAPKVNLQTTGKGNKGSSTSSLLLVTYASSHIILLFTSIVPITTLHDLTHTR